MALRVLTTVDYLKGKEKEKYMSGGKINMYNLYDDVTKIPSIKDLEAMDYEAARNIIMAVKEKHTNKALSKAWGVSDYTIYQKIYVKYGIPVRGDKRQKDNAKKNSTRPEIIVANNDLVLEKQREEIVQAALVIKTGIQEVMKKFEEKEFEGFSLKLKGAFTGKQIQDRLLALMGALIMENEFFIAFEVREIEQKEKDG